MNILILILKCPVSEEVSSPRDLLSDAPDTNHSNVLADDLASPGTDGASVSPGSSELRPSQAPAVASSSTTMSPATAVSRPRPDVSPSVHQNPDWLKQLKANFKAEIILPCSARCREAAENDEYIEVDIKFYGLTFSSV